MSVQLEPFPTSRISDGDVAVLEFTEDTCDFYNCTETNNYVHIRLTDDDDFYRHARLLKFSITI